MSHTDTSAQADASELDPHGEVTVDDVALSAELAGAEGTALSPDIAAYALRLGDDALVLSQQLAWWIARAPELEEDLALANIALDLLGHARSLLRYAGTVDGRTEDDLAYQRDEAEFRCAWLFAVPHGDFAQTIARQLLASTYMFELYGALAASADPTLAAIAAKAVKEVEYHRDHAVQWSLRLAGGTDESRRRFVGALTDLWPYVDELFRDDALIERLSAIVPRVTTPEATEVPAEQAPVAVRPSTLRPAFDAVIHAVLAEEGVAVPDAAPSRAGGRDGIHHPALGPMLAEMQVLARAHPEATW